MVFWRADTRKRITIETVLILALQLAYLYSEISMYYMSAGIKRTGELETCGLYGVSGQDVQL
jgi:hypothetical protein